MSRQDKLIARFTRKPKDFTWNELVRMLKGFGYKEITLGKTAGSRRRFIHSTAVTITLHKPHPDNVLKRYQLEQVFEWLSEEGFLSS